MEGSTRLPRHYRLHQRSQMYSWINGLQMGFSSPIKFLSNPLKKSKGTHASVVYTIICNTLPQNGEHSVDQCTAELEKELSNCPSHKFKETHSLTIRERGQQQLLFAQIQEKMKKKGQPCPPRPLPPYRDVLGLKTCLTNQNSQPMNKELPQRFCKHCLKGRSGMLGGRSQS